MNAIAPLAAMLLIAASAAAQSHAREVTAAVRLLRGRAPERLQWRYSQHLDLDGNGQRDEVFISQDRTRFYVGAVTGPISTDSLVSFVSFARDGSSQSSLCGPFESLKPERLANRGDLVEMLTAAPEGYPFGKTRRWTATDRRRMR